MYVCFSKFYRNSTKISFIPFCFFFFSKITFAQVLRNFKNTFHFNENITHRERKINSWIFFPWWKIDAHKSTIVFNRLIGSETTLIISTPYLSPCLFVWTRTYSYYENVQHFSQKQVYKNTAIIIIFPKKKDRCHFMFRYRNRNYRLDNFWTFCKWNGL